MSDTESATSTIAIDTGGTFTDIILSVAGHAHVLKVPSTPDDPARAALEGMAAILDRAALRPGALIHGSTVATNALLERTGARIALITNAGFEDIIEIGRQNRPHLYALSSTRPPALVERALRIGIRGRLDHLGRETAALDPAEMQTLPERVAGADAVAICLLHSYANPQHEAAVETELQENGVVFISRSSALLPEFREYERTATTVVNAYVLPLMNGYLERLESASDTRVRIMGSAGGALPVAQARREPVHTVLSGPAGGVAGALAVARAAGFEHILTFDMGGTSTDVSLCPGQPLYTRDLVISAMPVAIPVLDIHTVGAGGGSLATVDAGGALRVGPRSAGARPGPICYGRGGSEVTVTDANVWLGRLPASSLLGGSQSLDRASIAEPLARLAERMQTAPEAAAAGVLSVINTTMEGALRVISVERGYDSADFTLVAFGGAAGLHAADLAAGLGVPRVLIPPHPGLLSAFGMLVAAVKKTVARTVLLRADDAATESGIAKIFEELERSAMSEMATEEIAAADVSVTRSIDARYAGQSHELRVSAQNWSEALHIAHEARYGFANRESIAEAVTLRVEAAAPTPATPVFESTIAAAPRRVERVFDGHQWIEVMVWPRSALAGPVAGPAIIAEYSATTWVPAGWQIEPLANGALLMGRM